VWWSGGGSGGGGGGGGGAQEHVVATRVWGDCGRNPTQVMAPIRFHFQMKTKKTKKKKVDEYLF
jgi:hypothetical protein